MVLLAQRADLDHLAGLGRHRRLTPRTGIDFSSNDYLALAGDPRLSAAVREAIERGVAVGSGGSRLLRGNDPEHERLEEAATAFFGSDSALFFGSGYAANVAILATLPQRGDLILHDELVHASAHDGMRQSRAAMQAIAHNDATAFDDAISRWRGGGGTGTPWIVVESLYSMDGDRAPLHDLADIAARHDAMLIIDEAHATGVFGADGRGEAAALQGQDRVITLHTLGKALGCEGALVCGSRTVRDFLINRGRTFIFSTAPSPLMAAAACAALEVLATDPARIERLHALIGHAARRFASLGSAVQGTQIIPHIIGDDRRTVDVAAAVQRAGFDVRAIRPPTVAAGTARLRITLTLHVDIAQIDALAGAVEDILA